MAPQLGSGLLLKIIALLTHRFKEIIKFTSVADVTKEMILKNYEILLIYNKEKQND